MTAWTMEDPNIQGHFLTMSTGATGLTCIGRVDSNVLSPSFFRFGGELAMPTIDFGKGLFLFPEKARVRNLFTVGKSSKRLQADIDTHLSWSRFKPLRFALTTQRDIPLASRRALHGTGFEVALDGTVVDHFDTANFGECPTVIMRHASRVSFSL
jgi:hypothetical protein